VKPLQTRRHSNGQVAEVKLKRDGQFYAYSRAPNTAELDVSYGHETRSLLRAQQVADYLAHAGCDGLRCGAWQDAHHDDPECLEALQREASTSAGCQHGTFSNTQPMR